MKEYTVPQARKFIRQQLQRLLSALEDTREGPEQKALASAEIEEARMLFLKSRDAEGEELAQIYEKGSALLVDAWNHLHATEAIEYSSNAQRPARRYRKMNAVKIWRPHGVES